MTHCCANTSKVATSGGCVFSQADSIYILYLLDKYGYFSYLCV